MLRLTALPLPHPIQQSASFLVKDDRNEKIAEMRYERTKPDERYRVFLITKDGDIIPTGESAIATSQHAKKCVMDYLDRQKIE